MENLGVKRDYWEGARLFLYGVGLGEPYPPLSYCLHDRVAAGRARQCRLAEVGDMAIAFRDEINICLEKIKDGLADASLAEGNQWPYDCEKQCFKRLVEIMQAEEARQEKQEQAQRGSK